MRRVIAAIILCLVALASHPARAGVTGARVVSIGEIGKTDPVGVVQPGIEGRPGIRFGMELVPEGTPQGAPMVLEARLKRPDDPADSPPMRWLVAARIGIPVLSVWEFAYDWEVEPGLWTMTVSYEDAVLATASFMVVQPDPQSQPQTQASSKPGEPRQDKKASDAPPAKPPAAPPAPSPKPGDAKASTGKQSEAQKPETSRSDSPKTDSPRQENAKPDTQKPAAPRQDASPPAPQKDRPAKPLAEVQGQGQIQGSSPAVNQGQSSPKDLAGVSGKRVQVLVAGVYSEEARALWVAAFLKKRGVKACVRVEDRGGKKRWSLVAGWRDTPEEARRAKDELTPTVGEIVIVPMSAADLEKGLQCR
ncbi:MAG: neurofilament medium [Desulfovibrionaceae bacterium]|nr:MAG: neurofilament medium [Desulfovibrionaceae bacterium]